MATNGTFDADTDWTKGDGWTIAAGVAHCDGSQGDWTNLYQDAGIIAGKVYITKYTLSNHSGSSVRINVGASNPGTWRHANGTYIESIFTLPGSNSNVYLTGMTSFIGDIDNVVVLEAASFYIESMTPVYVKNEPPILEDKLIIKFVSLEAVDASGSIP